MKKIGLLGVLALGILVACKDTTKFTIKGTLKNAVPTHKVFLYAFTNNEMKAVDSTNVSDKGEFQLSYSNAEANFYRISNGTGDYILIAKNGDAIKFEADVRDEAQNYEVSGGEDADKMAELNKLKHKYQSKLAEINNDFKKKLEASPDKRQALMEELSPVYSKTMGELNEAIAKFAADNRKSLTSFYAISMVDPMGNDKILVDYAEKVDASLLKNPMVKSFVERTMKLKAVQVGQPAPDFSIPSVDGKSTIKLSDFKGKYVLLDFWASWCAPCRQENPNVVKAFQKYNSRNFTILGISLDKDKAAWEKAIKDDNLNWSHGGELKDFESQVAQLYQIEAIPSSFILNPEGKIIAKNLRDKELAKFLEDNLPK